MKVFKNEIIELDIRGQICPSCLLIALKEVNKLQDGLRNGTKQLHIFSDDRQSTGTIPDAVKNMGYQVLVVKEQDWYRIKVSAV